MGQSALLSDLQRPRWIIETLKRPKPVDGVEQLLPETRDDSWQFRVRPGVERVRFGNPGSRLGYARDAVSSYFVFRTLREKGILPAGLRFQISIPMVNSVVRPLYFPDAQGPRPRAAGLRGSARAPRSR